MEELLEQNRALAQRCLESSGKMKGMAIDLDEVRKMSLSFESQLRNLESEHEKVIDESATLQQKYQYALKEKSELEQLAESRQKELESATKERQGLSSPAS